MPKVRAAAALAALLLAAVCAACAPGDPRISPLPGRPAQQESGTASPGAEAEAESEAPEPQVPGVQVALAEDAGFGPILVDAQGRTLYLFEGDTSTRSTCYEDCATMWPPLTTPGFPTAGAGVDDGLLGVGQRTDGTSQVLYKGHPLYYFAEDAAPGEAGGLALAQWFPVDAVGDRVTGG
jgi:predicted lipoprotein with Yx(FWY)xxD motif